MREIITAFIILLIVLLMPWVVLLYQRYIEFCCDKIKARREIREKQDNDQKEKE